MELADMLKRWNAPVSTNRPQGISRATHVDDEGIQLAQRPLPPRATPATWTCQSDSDAAPLGIVVIPKNNTEYRTYFRRASSRLSAALVCGSKSKKSGQPRLPGQRNERR